MTTYTTFQPEEIENVPEHLYPAIIEAFEERYYDVLADVLADDADNLTETLQYIFPGFKHLRYDVSYHQGAGASWEGHILFSDEWNFPHVMGVFTAMKNAEREYPHTVKLLREQLGDTLDALRLAAADHKFRELPAPEMMVQWDDSSHYAHENTMGIEPLIEGEYPYDWFYWWLEENKLVDPDDDLGEHADALEAEYVKRVQDHMWDFAEGVAKFIHTHMTECYEYTQTWEWVSDFLISNDISVSIDEDTGDVEFDRE